MKLVPKLLACLGKSPHTMDDDRLSSDAADALPKAQPTKRQTARTAVNLPPIRGQRASSSTGTESSTGTSTIRAGAFTCSGAAPVNVLPAAVKSTAAAALSATECAAGDDPVKVFQHPDISFAAPAQQRIHPDHKPLALVTRWQYLSRESAEENLCYGNFMAGSIEKTAADVSSGEIGNLSQLWGRAREARLESFLLQKNASTPDDLSTEWSRGFYKDAGRERIADSLRTKIEVRYCYIEDQIVGKARAVLEKGKQTRMLSDSVDGEQSHANWDDGDSRLTYIPGNEGDGPVDYVLRISAPKIPGSENQREDSRLTAIWHINAEGTRDDPSDLSRLWVNEISINNVIDGGSTKSFAETDAYRQTNAAFTNALKATERSEILDHAFEGYWNLVVAAPDHRGSAAKSHYVLQSILLAKGIDLPPAREGLAPDLEAMARTRPDWLLHARDVFGIT